MSIAHLYNQFVAEQYDVDPFSIFSTSREVVFEQLPQDLGPSPMVLDLGCGTGTWLEAMHGRHPGARLYGLDPSRKMLDRAESRCPMLAVCGDLLKADRHFAPGNFDVIAMHFVLAYVDTRAALRQAHRLLRPGGILTLVTSTFRDTLPHIGEIGRAFVDVDEQRRAGGVPADRDALVALMGEVGLQVERTDLLARELSFANFDEFYAFAVPGGWLVQHAAILDQLRQAKEPLDGLFPLRDQFRGVAVLARKRAAPGV